MTKIFNDPADFAGDMLSGFARAFPGFVQRVPGGVVRATQAAPGKVAVVTGGGSGHYPAFAGWVGTGLADAAVVGDVFSSPSTQQVVAVATAADAGAGVVLSYGNYAGDVLNFEAARAQLTESGIPVRSVVVSDDLASAPRDERSLRRGTAGDLVVVKIAGAAAEAGYDLEGVVRVAERTNAGTVSLGVAFEGPTPPGSPGPLFTMNEGRMGVGLGIHGEPGVSEEPLLGARELAGLLTGRVLAERPESARRATVLLNGMGATKYEELFVLWNEVVPALEAEGVEIVEPEVGELITSLDMAGLSLTITWLDDELEALWGAPAQSPAYRKGPAEAAPLTPRPVPEIVERAIPESSEASRHVAKLVHAAFETAANALAEAEPELGELDSVAGNGDHGRVMARGARAAATAAGRAVEAGAGTATTLLFAADAWSDRAGGSSGALWGAGLRAAARVLADTDPPPNAVQAACRSALDAVTTYGNARVGDKTVVDAFLPFTESLEADLAAELPLGPAWVNASAVAARAAEATASLSPRLGRARPLAARSLGHRDPGAVSFAVVVTAIAEHVA
ncbi:D-erythrulose kinase [Prauserella marina]|uniref:Dihydroxyacetone kinase n=1 Tax=Prauserella marina TaxID=530584 RepID=A0A222VPJ2_9PSEU|nr:dihydroxyacetone kinase family protein [Prauserella marina]ASR35839.1 D-erythrulose kinase [Prauserella marina]PWV84248.1 homodimeric dihydroxyacetone kinase [Prauserella marina]SDC27072.1 dihydroxyacetone kinase [Prauserella marina]